MTDPTPASLLSRPATRRQFLRAASTAALAPVVLTATGCDLFSKQAASKTAPTTHIFVGRPDLKPPLITTTATGPAVASGLIFITANGSLIVDNLGSPVWYQPAPPGKSVSDLNLQLYQGQPVLTWWEGSVIAPPGFGRGEHVIMDSQYRELHRIQAGNGQQADLHELVLTPQGTALLTAFQPVAADLSAQGGSAKGMIFDCLVQEIELSSGRVILEWHSRDHVATAESYAPAPKSGTTTYDYFHINSIDVGPDGDLLISARNTWALYKLRRQTGAVVWRLGGKQTDFTLGSGVKFSWQHDARWRPDGSLTLFDDAASPTEEPQSRGLQLLVDESAKTVALKQQFTHPGGLLATSQGNMQRLDDGHLLIGWGALPYFSEFTATGEMIFDGKLATNQSYRAFRFPWTGKPTTTPTVVGRRAGNGNLQLFTSWNGATDVTKWEVHAGASAAALARVAVAARTGFETTISVAGSGPFVAAHALDSAGGLLGISPTIQV
jgi:Arylsulfotransferase (ASST)